MTPERKREFEAAWPRLAEMLQHLLARKKVPADRREDLIQETGYRLCKMWDKVDQERELWPLTVTIAINLLRDEGRRRFSEVALDLPEVPAIQDVERAGIARVELRRVDAAMRKLSASHRSILLAEVGSGHRDPSLSPDAQKMLRMRARQKLSQLIQKVPGLLPLRLRRATEFFPGIFGGSEGVIQTLTCATCLLIGMGTFLGTSAITAPATAGTVRPSTQREVTASAGTADARSSLALAQARAGGGTRGVRGVSDLQAAKSTGRASRPATKQSDKGKGGNKPGGLPLPNPSVPSSELPTGPQIPDAGSPEPSVPQVDPGTPHPPEGPEAPPAPQAPHAPEAPSTPSTPTTPEGSGPSLPSLPVTVHVAVPGGSGSSNGK